MATTGTLIPVKMEKKHVELPEVQGFRCGSQEHEVKLAEWLRTTTIDNLTAGHKYWLYRLDTPTGPLVGYASFTTYKFKTTEGAGGEREVKCYEIPLLAVHSDYQGRPEGCDPERRFSRQIVRHLQREARERQQNGTREKLLTLYVHPNAEPAHKLYTRCGFSFAPDRVLTTPDIPPEVGPGYLGMDYVW